MDNSRTPDLESGGGLPITEFTSLAEALVFLNKQRRTDEALYCIVLKDDLFYVAPFGTGYQLIEVGYKLVYGG